MSRATVKASAAPMSGLGDMPVEEQVRWLTDALHNLSMSDHDVIESLKSDLLKYGRHLEECPPSAITITGCACGWRQLVAAVWPR